MKTIKHIPDHLLAEIADLLKTVRMIEVQDYLGNSIQVIPIRDYHGLINYQVMALDGQILTLSFGGGGDFYV